MKHFHSPLLQIFWRDVCWLVGWLISSLLTLHAMCWWQHRLLQILCSAAQIRDILLHSLHRTFWCWALVVSGCSCLSLICFVVGQVGSKDSSVLAPCWLGFSWELGRHQFGHRGQRAWMRSVKIIQNFILFHVFVLGQHKSSQVKRALETSDKYC